MVHVLLQQAAKSLSCGEMGGAWIMNKRIPPSIWPCGGNQSIYTYVSLVFTTRPNRTYLYWISPQNYLFCAPVLITKENGLFASPCETDTRGVGTQGQTFTVQCHWTRKGFKVVLKDTSTGMSQGIKPLHSNPTRPRCAEEANYSDCQSAFNGSADDEQPGVVSETSIL